MSSRELGIEGSGSFLFCLFYQLPIVAQNCIGIPHPRALVFPKNSIGIPHPRAPCLSQGPSVFPWASLSVLILESREQRYFVDLEGLFACHHQQKGRSCSLAL